MDISNFHLYLLKIYFKNVKYINKYFFLWDFFLKHFFGKYFARDEHALFRKYFSRIYGLVLEIINVDV